MNYVEQFDFVTLTETFVDNSFDMSDFFVSMSNMLVLLCQVVVPRETIGGRYSDGKKALQ